MKRDLRGERCHFSNCPPILAGWPFPQMTEEPLKPGLGTNYMSRPFSTCAYPMHLATAVKFARPTFNSMAGDEQRPAGFEGCDVWATILDPRIVANENGGDVLVVDGAGYLGCALIGSTLAEYGRNNAFRGYHTRRRQGCGRYIHARLCRQSAGLGSTERREAWNGMYRRGGLIRGCKLRAGALALQRRRWDLVSSRALHSRSFRAQVTVTSPLFLTRRSP